MIMNCMCMEHSKYLVLRLTDYDKFITIPRQNMKNLDAKNIIS